MASSRVRRRLPELDLPASFSRTELDRWVRRIESRRLRTLVSRALEEALSHAEPAHRTGRT